MSAFSAKGPSLVFGGTRFRHLPSPRFRMPSKMIRSATKGRGRLQVIGAERLLPHGEHPPAHGLGPYIAVFVESSTAPRPPRVIATSD